MTRIAVAPIVEGHGEIEAVPVLLRRLWTELRLIPPDPESSGLKKAWLQRYFRGKYTETLEQPALTAKMDLRLCRSRAPSFDKLCRELEKRM